MVRKKALKSDSQRRVPVLTGVHLVPKLIHEVNKANADDRPENDTLRGALEFVASLATVPEPARTVTRKGTVKLTWRHGDAHAHLSFSPTLAMPEFRVVDSSGSTHLFGGGKTKLHPNQVTQAVRALAH